MQKLITALAICLIATISAIAAPIDEAKRLYNSGDYEAAVAKLQTLKKRSPRDANVNYWLGASYLALGQIDEAVEALTAAQNRGSALAAETLANMAFDNYDVDMADESIDAWEKALAKNKNADTEPIDILRSRLVMMRNMLQRVERIEIIDSVNVDSADFFTHYRLSPEAGQLLTADEADVPARNVVYVPQNRRRMIWSQTDTAANAVLTSASILDDGTIDRSAALNGDFSENGDADFPFMMSDGITLYYAATGDNSLGGYDIFMTRMGDDGYLQPQNVGMPYNSPYDDYMLVIDESTGAGWFASNRNQIPGKVTIYTFIPSQSRVNYDPDDPKLGALARINSIADTQTLSRAADNVRQRIASINETERSKLRSSRLSFDMSMGNGRVYTSLNDFTNMQARKEMAVLLKAQNELDAQLERIAELRVRYGRGDRSVASDILDAEAAIEYSRQQITDLRNKVIRLETK